MKCSLGVKSRRHTGKTHWKGRTGNRRRKQFSFPYKDTDIWNANIW